MMLLVLLHTQIYVRLEKITCTYCLKYRRNGNNNSTGDGEFTVYGRYCVLYIVYIDTHLQKLFRSLREKKS